MCTIQMPYFLVPTCSPAKSPGMDCTLLPLGAVLHSRVQGDKGDVSLHLSVAVGDRQNRVALCSYSDARMLHAAIGSQAA